MSDILTNVNNDLCIGGVKCLSLKEKYGTPLYVFCEDYIEKMCQTFTESINKYYGLGAVSYASKAFSCKEIYRLIDKYSMWADVVSDGEMYTALSSGFSSKKLIFHGNNKTDLEIEYALNNKIKYFVLDSYEEVDKLEELLALKNITQDVLIRVNPGVEAHTHHYIQTAKVDSKFGFSIDNKEAEKFIKYVKTKKNINLVGLHCHIGSQIFDVNSFLLAVDKMTDFYKYLKLNYNLEFDVLNLGGGFGIWYSDNDRKFDFLDYEDFLKTIFNHLNSKIIENKIKKPFLIIEPGRSIVGEAGCTLYTVGSIKKIPNVKNYVSVDGGMFDNPRFALYQAKYTVLSANKYLEDKKDAYTVAGKCCESGDIIAENVSLPNIKRGDVLCVLSTGAYNYSMASNYNRNIIPAVVFVKNGKSRLIVKRSDISDIVKNDI